jgi:voltage-gated potassium channel
MTKRQEIDAFVDRHNVPWEVALGILAVGYLVLSFTADLGGGIFAWAIGPLAAIFIAEFSLRFWAATSRVQYLRGHWIDLVSCIPLVGGLRSLRLLRLLRLGAAARVLTVGDHVGHRRGGGRQSLWYLGPLLILLWFGAALAYWSFEHGVNHQLHSFGDALYWAGITATTVGYGDTTPITPEGRVLAGILIFLGIGLIGFASARLTSKWLNVDDGVTVLGAKVSSLEREIVSLREVLLAQRLPNESSPAPEERFSTLSIGDRSDRPHR